MSAADGKKAANESRQPVGKTFWKLHYSLANHVFLTSGTGGFTNCTDPKAKDSVVYVVEEPFSRKSKAQTDEQFMTTMKNRVSAVGWDLKPSGDKVQSATKNGIEVQLRLLDRTGDSAALARLDVRGKCTNVGDAKDDIFHAYGGSERDEYTSTSASPSPIPSFLSSD
ncbi:hypothetical protein AB0M32_38820 [Streptomyces sp. NPDC051985]|uniref:hypothetical protein n=1 Tax=Streptomyces sp. NPDC051985 TaxID=3155807 RepID=UPI0034385627